MGKDKATVQDFKQFASNAERFLASGLSINSLRTNNLLRKEEWVELDTALLQVAQERLTGIEDLRARGLIHNLGGLGTLLSQWESQSDMTDAQIDMGGDTAGQEDTIEFKLHSVPVPIVHKDFRLNIRRLEASRRLGEGLDVTQGTVAARKVAEALESMLFNGAGLTVDGNAIYGYTTHPDRNTGTATGSWATIANIYSTVLNMIRDAQTDRMFGPYYLYTAGNVWPDLLQVYDDGSGQTARDRVLGIPGLEDVRVSERLEDGEAVLVQMTRDTIDLAVAQDIVPVEWSTVGGMISHYKVMAVMVPRLKVDQGGRMGLVHYSGLRPTPDES